MAEKIIEKQLGIAYLPERGVIVNIGGVLTPDSPSAPVAKPTEPLHDKEDKQGTVAAWGAANDFPQLVLKDAEADPFMHPLNKLKAGILYGTGAEIVAVDYDDKGNDIIIKDPKIVPDLLKAREFHKNAGVDRFLMDAVVNFYWFYNYFPELIMSKDHKTIANINCLRAKECRWTLRKAGEMVSSHCLVNANWGNGGNEDNSIKIPTIDPHNFAVDTLRDKPSLKKFVLPMSYPDPDRPYYSLAPWNVYRASKWADFVRKVPIFKEALMRNQMLVRWQIDVSTDFWEWKYKEAWGKFTYDERNKAVDEFLDEMHDKLAGSQNAGKALLTHSVYDPKDRSNRQMVKITKLDDKVQSGAYIEDSAEGSSFAMLMFGLHPTLVGHAPGSGKSSMGAGSGSDQRVAWNNYLKSCSMEKDIIFAPLEFIRDYNGWDPRLKWRFKNAENTELLPNQMAS